MNLSYIIFLLTFLVYPIVAFVFSQFIIVHRNLNLIKLLFVFFLLHNILFFFGISIIGNYPDYFIFSTEYLVFCFIINFISAPKNIFLKIVEKFGIAAIFIGTFIGLIGIVLFPVVSQDYETDRLFLFTSNGKTYETRRYSFGTVSAASTRYTFETYRNFMFFPIELKIDKTVFFDHRTSLKIGDDELKIALKQTSNKSQLIFTSTNGKSYVKSIDSWFCFHNY